MIQNPKLHAIVQIRNLVYGLATDWTALKTLGAEVDDRLEAVNILFVNNAPGEVHEEWLSAIGKIQANRLALKKIRNEVVGKINARDSKDLATIWDSHHQYSSELSQLFNWLYRWGNTHLQEETKADWENTWAALFAQVATIQELVSASSLHLAMISAYTPEEVDELTDTILRNMPKHYTIAEASQYEKEYMEAYEELKQEATQKKNLWDRFLDILAGGAQQSPAERVMMQRWVDGEKGTL